jgi:hypothetical protein
VDTDVLGDFPIGGSARGIGRHNDGLSVTAILGNLRQRCGSAGGRRCACGTLRVSSAIEALRCARVTNASSPRYIGWPRPCQMLSPTLSWTKLRYRRRASSRDALNGLSPPPAKSVAAPLQSSPGGCSRAIAPVHRPSPPAPAYKAIPIGPVRVEYGHGPGPGRTLGLRAGKGPPRARVQVHSVSFLPSLSAKAPTIMTMTSINAYDGQVHRRTVPDVLQDADVEVTTLFHGCRMTFRRTLLEQEQFEPCLR